MVFLLHFNSQRLRNRRQEFISTPGAQARGPQIIHLGLAPVSISTPDAKGIPYSHDTIYLDSYFYSRCPRKEHLMISFQICILDFHEKGSQNATM